MLADDQSYCKLLMAGCASGAAESRLTPSKSRRQTASLDFRTTPQIPVFVAFSLANRLSRRTRLRLDRHTMDSGFRCHIPENLPGPDRDRLFVLVEHVQGKCTLWQQLSCILSAVTTGRQPALLNACIEFALNQTCAESLAHEFRSPPSDDSACRCLNAQT